MEIAAVLGDRELAMVRGFLAELGEPTPSLENSESDLEAVQKMFIRGEAGVLVMDLDLQAVIGSTTIAALKEQKHFGSMPIIVLSESEELTKACMKAGAAAGLKKPIPSEELRAAIRKVLFDPSSSGDAGKDARGSRRQPMEAPCLVSTGSGKQRGVLKDISLVGARVITRASLSPDALLALWVAVPGSSPLKIIQFKAKVVRKSERGFGLAFREMDQSTRAFLSAFTKKN